MGEVVDEARNLLPNLSQNDLGWSGTAFVPCWGSELDIHLTCHDGVLEARQADTVRALLGHTEDLRPGFERALFEYYQEDVDGTYCAYGPDGRPVPGSGPPKLTEPSQVWPLIDGPEVYIKWFFRTPSAVEFELSFNCEWDREHGLGVLYHDFQPVEFGAWDL
jgi:hypothetical protein